MHAAGVPRQGPGGRAFLHATDYQPSPEVTSDEYPLLLTTGRTVYQFHTRTKTGRAPQLDAAAPDAWVELNAADADRLGIAEGDLVGVSSPRGGIQARARIGHVRPGVVFVPFHYGYFDVERADRVPRAANELTITAWDPVSKQPLFKVAAVRVAKLENGHGPAPAPTVGGSAPVDAAVPPTAGGADAEATSVLQEV
ncbi:molybdopterin oxidoreductase family protein [Dactylosporangium sp. NPDC051541]|uniref:molybdopterin oxidoreductase family protein n=1 Tax=Dactylosporangium sp. NPDC051541 TaxID=3363977 RepID=UPI00378FCBFB